MSRLTNLWTLDEGTGSSIADLSGNGGDGTLDDSPAWISGVASNALRLQLAKTYDNNGFPAIISLSRVDTGRWNHFAFTFDGTTARAWLNGQCEATGSWTNGVGYANFELTLAQYCGSPSDWFDGQLDEVRVYGTALSPAELRTLAAAHDYSYDANGNLTGDRVWGYEYDRENRLTVATNGAVRIDYRYDAFGRLIERRSSGASASTNRMYYAGWQLIAEYDGGGNLDRKYVYGPGIDGPVLMSGGGTNYYYHADSLGSVTEITDTTGTKLESYTYDVYGTPTIRDGDGAVITASVTGNRLMFTGRDRDPETGLYNYRYRYYSAGLGRFVQVDPVSVAGGDLNLYRYVQGQPVTLRDAYGLFPWGLVIVIGALVGLYIGISAVIDEYGAAGGFSPELTESLPAIGTIPSTLPPAVIGVAFPPVIVSGPPTAADAALDIAVDLGADLGIEELDECLDAE